MKSFRNLGALALLLSTLVLSGCGFEVVDTGYRGVQTRFGEVNMEKGCLPEGWHWYSPFSESITEMEVRVQKATGTANTYTRDVQQADITYTVNYNLSSSDCHVVFREVGRDWYQRLVPQVVEGELKKVVGQYEAVDLVAHRAKATADVRKAITDALKTTHVNITGFEMVNIGYHKNFEKAVEEKVVAIQKAIEEKNRTVQVQEQSKQKVIEAQAIAESMRIRANALAQNPKLVEYEAVQKWDGKLPQYMFGNGTTPFIDLRK